MSAASVRAEAKRLLALSLEGGAVSSDRVGAVLAALAKSRPAHTLRPLLRAYLANIRRELTRGEVSRLVVETAAKVLEQNLDDAQRGRLNEAAVKQLAR